MNGLLVIENNRDVGPVREGLQLLFYCEVE